MDSTKRRAAARNDSDNEGRKSTAEYWNAHWLRDRNKRLPSSLNVSVWDLKRLLKRHLRPGCTYLEIGCAPGKMLAWAAVAVGAQVSGMDYSATGVDATKRLFRELHLEADIRQDDIFHHSFRESSFDIVGSFGLIEHFDDPREIIRKHVQLVRPGGTALIVIPDYLGLYGRWQRHFDPQNLEIHNTKIMDLASLRSCTPLDLAETIRVYRDGRMSPWLVTLHKKMPMPIAKGFYYFLNLCGLFQPLRIKNLCWMIVLEVIRK